MKTPIASPRLSANDDPRRNVRHTIRYTESENAVLYSLAEHADKRIGDYIRLSSLGCKAPRAKSRMSAEQQQACRLVVWVAQQVEDFILQTGPIMADAAQAQELNITMLTIAKCLNEFATGRIHFVVTGATPTKFNNPRAT
jgi:hypothetical protein